jgi:DNA repair protein REV1
LANLRKLGIDPEVFDQLPIADQREQLAIQRALQKKSPKDTSIFRPRSKVEPVGRIIAGQKFVPRKLPNPKANYIEDPVLVRKGRKGSAPTNFIQTDDLQNVITQWVDSFDDEPPREKDVNYFAKFLVTCVDSYSPTETPLMRAISVLKWWRIVLRTRWTEPFWSSSTVFPAPPEMTDESDVGERWWMAFWEVKARMDVALQPKFGGVISLK